jgi:hypothetical protein
MAWLLVTAVTALALAGCLRVRAGVTIDSQDQVSGEVVVATLRTGPQDAGPQPSVPPQFTDRVSTQLYDLEGYVGTRLFFDELALAEFNELARVLLGPELGPTASLELRRSGSLLSLAGGADLTRLAPNAADVQVQVTFPGEVIESNGEEDVGGTVTWTVPGGQVSQLTAVAEAEDPNEPPFLQFVALGGAGLGVVAVLVAVLAFIAHRRATRLE